MMKSDQKIGDTARKNSDMPSKGGRAESSGKFMCVVCAIFLLFAAYVVGILLAATPATVAPDTRITVADPGSSFDDCEILDEDCTEAGGCGWSYLCGGSDNAVCKIYDCGTTYGVLTQDGAGNVGAERKQKSVVVNNDKKDACGKSMEIVQQECVDGEMQVMVKLDPDGECKIGGFVLLYEGKGMQPNHFTALKGDNYLIRADVCGRIDSIIPQNAEGAPIF